MEKKRVIMITLMVFLGLLSAVLGFICEAWRIKESEMILTSRHDCEYPSGPALVFGVTAALTLIISEIILTVLAGCLCCKRNPRQTFSSEQCAPIYFILSWFTCSMALMFFISGVVLSGWPRWRVMEDEDSFVGYFCMGLKPGIFTGASFLSITTVILNLFYIRHSSPPKSNDRPALAHVANIALGRPQIPTVVQEPVFVHEDTYVRRQIAE